jgi:hypothetical protein
MIDGILVSLLSWCPERLRFKPTMQQNFFCPCTLISLYYLLEYYEGDKQGLDISFLLDELC